MGQIVSIAAKPKRCNANQLSQVPTPAAGEHILVSSDNSMNAAGQGNFDSYIVGDGKTAATELPLIKTYANDVDDEPTAGSDKLVKSGGVFKALEGNALVDRNLNFSSGASSNFFNITALTNKVYAYVKIDNISGTLRFKNSGYVDLAVYEFEDGVPFYCLIPANVSILWFSLDEALSSAVTAHIYITNDSIKAQTGSVLNEANGYTDNKVSDTVKFSAQSLTDTQKIQAQTNINIQGGIFNVSEVYPTGGTDGTNIYTFGNAIDKVPTVYRKQGLIVAYISEDGPVFVRYNRSGAYNATSYRYGPENWTMLDIKSFVNINRERGKTDAYDTKANARNAIPAFYVKNPNGLVIAYLLSDGWHYERCISDIYVHSDNSKFEDLIPKAVQVSANQGLTNTEKQNALDNLGIGTVIGDIASIRSDVSEKSNFEGIKKFSNAQTLDLSTLTLSRKTLGTGGNLADHTYRLTTPLLRLGKYTNFAISKTGDYNFIYAFYKKNDDGTLTCNKYQSATGTAFTSVIRDGWEYLYITFLKNDGTTINVSDLSNFTVVCSSTYNIVEPQDVNTALKEIDENGSGFSINDYSSYKQGSLQGVSTEKSEQIKPLGVISGHTYAIKFSRRYASGINIMVSGYSDSNFSNNTTVKSWTLLPNPVIFTAQYGVNYITVSGIKTGGLTPSDMEALDIRIYDITPLAKLNYTAEKVATIVYSGSRYAQGMAIQNGYLFQAFSDGTVDIYAVDTMSIVQSSVQITTPTEESNPLHCNAIAFGDKYDSGDEFGVLWVAGNGIGTKMVGVRISRTSNDFTFTNVYEIAAPSIDDEVYGAVTQWFDFENKRMIQGAYNIYGTNDHINYNMFRYSYQSLDGDTTFTLVNTTELGESIYPVQDGKVNNGVLYFLYGGPNNDLMICVYDIVARKIVKYINLRVFSEIGADEEPQGIDVYKGQLYVSTTKGIYKIYM